MVETVGPSKPWDFLVNKIDKSHQALFNKIYQHTFSDSNDKVY